MSISQFVGRSVLVSFAVYLFTKGALVLRPKETVAAFSSLIAAVSLMSCGSETNGEPTTRTETEPLVVQQVNAMRDLKNWGVEHVRIGWSEKTARITNEGDTVVFCGVTDSERNFYPERYFAIRVHQARDLPILPIPSSPFVRCHVTWEYVASIVGRDEAALARMFEEPQPNGEPADTNHAASLVFMKDPMPPIGVQIDNRYTLLD